MDFRLTSDSLSAQRTGCIVAGVYGGRRLSTAALDLDEASGHDISRVIGRGDLEGALGATLLLHDVPNLAAERVLLVGLGSERAFMEGSYRAALDAALRLLRTTGAADATICLNELPVNGRDSAWKVEQAVLAVTECLYRFDKLKSKRSEAESALKKVALYVAEREEAPAAEAAIVRAAAISEGIVLAKDLGNLPGNLCTPTYLADQARKVGERHGFKVNVLEKEELEKLGMGGLLAVARGSDQPAKLVVMEYRGGGRDEQPVVLVGKGITFDAGGISIKPALEMDEMKFDMCGAASVIGALHAAALLKLALDIVGIIPATENMPGGNATKPGDIVTTMSGQTVEILDTDSEGRLVLCDGLSYAERFDPAAVIDVATLTGEMVKALGDIATGLFANDDALAREILDAGERAWDRAWQMPLWDEYQDALKSNFADFPNIGSGSDSAVTAACFLSRFTRGYPWAHLDIAGTASKGGADKGATGRPLALLVHFLVGRAGRHGHAEERNVLSKSDEPDHTSGISAPAITGHCLCRAVTITVAGEHDPRIGACHCRMCQRWSGGLFVCFTAAASAVTVTGDVARYRSSAFAERAFCPRCGSHLWFNDVDEGKEPESYSLMPGLFGAALDWPLRSEIYVDRAMPALRLSGDHRRKTRAEYEADNASVEGDMD